jgi:2'-hydroxyisoflavone reductase
LEILILGGTAWVGRETARQAIDRGHSVWCLARGESGPVAEGAKLIRADRRAPGAYGVARERRWDAVVEVSWQPGMVRGALTALSDRARQWIYVSSGSVYASHAVRDADETAELALPTELDEAGIDVYSEAKVACEAACRQARDDGLLIARSGLIGGPGDESDRTGYWVARAARDPLSPMLVPDAPHANAQAIDVRDLACWMLDCAERGTEGIYDAVGQVVRLDEWIELSRTVGQHSGDVVRADQEWLIAQGVAEFMGPDSLPLWLYDPDWDGFSARSGARAVAAGLQRRPLAETLRDTLEWERGQGLDRERRTGISAGREVELLASLERDRIQSTQ